MHGRMWMCNPQMAFYEAAHASTHRADREFSDLGNASFLPRQALWPIKEGTERIMSYKANTAMQESYKDRKYSNAN